MKKGEREQACNVCEGCGVLPIENVGTPRVPEFRPWPPEKLERHGTNPIACGACDGSGRVVVSTVDPRSVDDDRDGWRRREEAMRSAEYERDTSRGS